MKCEGDKTYDKPGDCPVCNMKLVSVNDGDKEKPNTHVSHSHHEQEYQQVHNHSHEDAKVEKYLCTMLCEGDKTYPEPGDCPVCGIHLKKVEKTVVSKIIYTCPMHPEIRQDHTGSYPKRGINT